MKHVSYVTGYSAMVFAFVVLSSLTTPAGAQLSGSGLSGVDPYAVGGVRGKPPPNPKPTPKPTPSPTPMPKSDGRTDWTGTTDSNFNNGTNWNAVTGSAPPAAGDVAWLT